MSHYDRSEVILSIGKIASKMSSGVGAQGGNIFQTEGYHLKLRLYEKLLFAVFDILEEGKLIAVYAFLSYLYFFSEIFITVFSMPIFSDLCPVIFVF